MNASPKHDPTDRWPEGEMATATDFVRHFGHYAATSKSKPIYIAQHGRVGWALLSAAQMTRLTEAETTAQVDDVRFDILLDSVSTIVLLVDPDFRITRLNSAAKRYFEIAEPIDNLVSFAKVLDGDYHAFIAETCTRVLKSGDTETFDIESERYPGRTLHFQVIPFPAGLMILADAVTQATHMRKHSAASAASDMAIDAAALLGRGRVDVRGTIITVNENLTGLAGSTADNMMGLRLPALFEQGSRNGIRDALDALLTNGDAFSIEASMLNNTGDNAPVTIGVGAERDGGCITGAAFVIIPRS